MSRIPGVMNYQNTTLHAVLVHLVVCPCECMFACLEGVLLMKHIHKSQHIKPEQLAEFGGSRVSISTLDLNVVLSHVPNIFCRPVGCVQLMKTITDGICLPTGFMKTVLHQE